MNATVEHWLSLANQLMLAFAIVFFLGLLIGMFLMRVRNRSYRDYLKRTRAELGQGEAPIEDHPNFDDFCRFHERSQTWPRHERK